MDPNMFSGRWTKLRFCSEGLSFFACCKNSFKAVFKFKECILLSLSGLRSSLLKFIRKVSLSTNTNRIWRASVHNDQEAQKMCHPFCTPPYGWCPLQMPLNISVLTCTPHENILLDACQCECARKPCRKGLVATWRILFLGTRHKGRKPSLEATLFGSKYN